MLAQPVISRPDMTLPEAETAALHAAYVDADVILEYGSGGSTVMAAEMPGKTVFSIESDRDWVEMMRAWFELNPPAFGTDVDVIWSDVGETKKWGYPADTKEYLRYAHYPLKIWDLDEFRQPDVVFIDGRFRPGCAIATALRTQKSVRVFWDDYTGRKTYHDTELYLGKPEIVGRMAVFVVEPMELQADRLLTVIEMMTRP